EIGPLPAVTSRGEYSLTFQQQVMEPGGYVDTHTHPGTETYYLFAGELSVRNATGIDRVPAGKSITGPPDRPFRPSNEGAVPVEMFALFVRDATRPPTSVAQFPTASAAPR